MALIKVAEHTFLFNFKKAIGCVVRTTMFSKVKLQYHLTGNINGTGRLVNHV